MAPEFRFPKYDLDKSIAAARKITERGAGARVSGAELAAMLGYSGTNNGAYLNRVAAARLFGLVEGEARGIAATDLAVRIIHAEYPEAAEQARIEAFKTVPLYAAFLDAFRGRELPDEQGMFNALVSRYRIPNAEKGRALDVLLASAGQAGLFRIGGPSRMIEPTATTSLVAKDESTSRDEARLSSQPDPSVRRFPKIIDGALDLMPSGPPWPEDEYQEWLSFFDQACRVYYRIARGAKS